MTSERSIERASKQASKQACGVIRVVNALGYTQSVGDDDDR